MAFRISSPEVEFAIEVAERAGRLAQIIQHQMVPQALAKDDRSPVTVADFAVQGLVGWMLERKLDSDTLVAEEDTRLLRTEAGKGTLEQVKEFLAQEGLPADGESVLQWIDRGGGAPRGRFWTLDPIDGTKGFLRQAQFATALALVEGGRVQVAILGCPNLSFDGNSSPRVGLLFAAVRGRGAWMRALQGPAGFDPIRVSSVSDPGRSRLLRSVETGHTNASLFGRILRRLGSTSEPVLMDSQAKYGLLASGRAELLLRLISRAHTDYREKIWDQAAGSLIVEEAGGMVTDLDGRVLDFSHGDTLAQNRGVVASNGQLHEPALSAIRHLEGIS